MKKEIKMKRTSFGDTVEIEAEAKENEDIVEKQNDEEVGIVHKHCKDVRFLLLIFYSVLTQKT